MIAITLAVLLLATCRMVCALGASILGAIRVDGSGLSVDCVARAAGGAALQFADDAVSRLRDGARAEVNSHVERGDNEFLSRDTSDILSTKR